MADAEEKEEEGGSGTTLKSYNPNTEGGEKEAADQIATTGRPALRAWHRGGQEGGGRRGGEGGGGTTLKSYNPNTEGGEQVL